MAYPLGSYAVWPRTAASGGRPQAGLEAVEKVVTTMGDRPLTLNLVAICVRKAKPNLARMALSPEFI
jgi:hypothetical protein